MAIELVTFGGLHILDDEGELDWLAGQRSRAALLVYLAVERRVSREVLTGVFWPESDTENARHALRQSLYQLKKAVRADWVESLSHELAVSDDIRIDVHEFSNAVEQDNLERAVQLYRGPFLDGVHLADLSAWESWVDSKRALYAREFRQACRDLIETKRSRGDFRGAIKIAEMWVARDSTDDEAHFRLIESLAQAGERADALRQYEAYERMLQLEGLEPPREIRDFTVNLRAQESILPKIDPASIPPEEIRRKRRLWIIPVAASAVIISASAIWLASRRETAEPGSPHAIAVLPFSVHGGESVGYLREGMVNLLTAAFDGASTVRPVDARATFSAANLSKSPENTAASLDAQLYVVGDITEAAERIQIDAAVYTRGKKSPEAHATVTGHRDSVFTLTDRLAAQLLASISDPAADRLLRTASVTTSSLAAFKEYLRGDQLMRAGQFESAAGQYEAAIAHDSAFAIAYYRLGLAREWAPLLGEDRAAAKAAQLASQLSPRDRNLLEAFRLWRSGNAAEAQAAYRSILARYPDDVDAWFQLAEIEFHHGPLLGKSLKLSEPAWRQVLRYEPYNLFAITHLVRIGLIDNRIAYVDSILASVPQKDLQNDRRLVELVMLRAIVRDDTSTSNATAGEIRKWGGLSAWRVAVFLTAFSSKPISMRRPVHEMMDPAASGSLRADVLWFVSLMDLASGQVRKSRITLEDARAAERDAARSGRNGFDQVTEWFWGTLPLPYADSTLERIRNAAERTKATNLTTLTFHHPDTDLGKTIQLEALRLYTIGLLSLRLGDTLKARTASDALEKLARSRDAAILSRDLDRGLRAHITWNQKRAEDATVLLKQLEMKDVQGDIAATPFATRGNERFLRAEILAALGRNSEALDWYASLGDGSVAEIPLRALSQYKQAEILERINRPREARAHYARFVDLWSNADPQFQQLVQVARKKMIDLEQKT